MRELPAERPTWAQHRIDGFRQELADTVTRGESIPLFDHAHSNTEELDRLVIKLALWVGWTITDESYELLRKDWTEPDDEARTRMLYTWAEGATEWLSSNLAPANAYFAHDGELGAFGCWTFEEEDYP